MAALIYNLRKLYNRMVGLKNPLLFFANASPLREAPVGFKGDFAYGHFWVVSKQSCQAHVWLNFSAIIVWLVRAKIFCPKIRYERENFCIVEDLDMGVEKGALDDLFDRFDCESGDLANLFEGIFAAVGVVNDSER